MMSPFIRIAAFGLLVAVAQAYVSFPVSILKSPAKSIGKSYFQNSASSLRFRSVLRASTKTDNEEASDTATKPPVNPEEITKKYGLEAGIFTALTSKDKEGKVDAKVLLAKYGSAYLVTSISLAAVSFAICYVLVDAGIDVAALLSKVGIAADGKAETAGTLAIAYAAHKAASPIRFPPTVALTPLTAKYLFNRKDDDTAERGEGGDK